MNESTTPAILSIAGVGKSYGEVRALDGVSFTLTQGFYALLGPNGAGKSTLFQILTGLFVADQGEVMVAGDNLRTDLVRALARMGVVFQQPSLDLDLTVQANLNFYARLHGLAPTEIRERSATELDRMGLSDVAGKPCRALSGGNRRKVELARALLTRPRLLLMDEATVGLDPASREMLLDYVHQLCRERGMGVLWATHLIDEAERADQVVILHRGRLLALGTPQALVQASGQASLLEAFLQLSGQPSDAEAGARPKAI
ncbi:MAG: ATP-binding cassette domain-containing protein [Thiothrix sp.]|nr:ATP-binding cassette domain-containing protein [Thiothrix sp.]HPE62037.1 ABC transporter ATP-binding protein [Thiolinea sp.]